MISLSKNLLTVELIYIKLEDKMPFCRVVFFFLFGLCFVCFFLPPPSSKSPWLQKAAILKARKNHNTLNFSFLMFVSHAEHYTEVRLLLICEITCLKQTLSAAPCFTVISDPGEVIPPICSLLEDF